MTGMREGWARRGAGGGGWLLPLLVTWAAACTPARAAEELSDSDRLRSLYSAEFRFTADGVPIVPIAVASGLQSVTIKGAPGLLLLPEGEGGPEIAADQEWTVRGHDLRAARLRHWAVIWRGRPGQGAQAQAAAERWQARGETARVFEQGTLFAVAGRILDRREILVAVAPSDTPAGAEAAHVRLKTRGTDEGRGLHTELVERPHGLVEAIGARSAIKVRNEGMLWFVPSGDSATEVRGRPADGGPEVGGSYFGKLYVTVDREGKLTVVNALPAEQLLAGLVPSEIFPRAPMESLKAQAVAARGHLLSKIGTRHVGDPFRLCSTTHCQVYSGAGKEHPRTTEAVQATRGELVFAEARDDLVDTVYSAACGGHSEHPELIWPAMPAARELRGHFDLTDASGGRSAGARPAPGSSEEAVRDFILRPPEVWDARASIGGTERFRWVVTRSAAELDRLLAPLKIGKPTALRVTERGVSGRALALEVTGARGRATITGELNIRQTLGGLRSSLFIVEMKDGAATFRGAGFGHGVGLCQTGSIGMGEAGKSHVEILRHYYPGSRIIKLW